MSAQLARPRRRVAITGIGCVTPLGIGVDALWNGLRAERSVVRGASRFDASIFRSQCAAEVDGFDAETYLDARRVKRHLRVVFQDLP